MALSKEENIQYSRHLILDKIGVSGQEKLKEAKVLIIGAGGLGCPILQYLTAAGVGTIAVVDHDVVEQSNLQRQILFTHEDIGKPKAEVAVKRLAQLNPYINLQPIVEKLTAENALNLFEYYDIIVDGTDNFPTRYLINDAAIITSKPVVFGSIFKFDGQVSVFNYESGPSYRCLFPNPPKFNTVPNCSEIGVLGILPGIIGCLQANEVIKIICNLEGILSGKLLTFSALSLNQTIFRFKKNKEKKITSLEKNYEFFCNIPTSISEITFSELKTLDKPYALLDVRTDIEREHFNIGGLHIPLAEIYNHLAEIPTKNPLIVYCKSGIRSKVAIQILKEKGFKNTLINLKNGILAVPLDN
ncbi:MAG: molybdopterin-synthase adenylyltransferase MoeB [Cellulophaga sp.]